MDTGHESLTYFPTIERLKDSQLVQDCECIRAGRMVNNSWEADEA